MKKMMNWMMAAILICGATTVTGSLTSCKKANTQEEQTAAKVVSTELIRTDKSWDGVELPDYFQGRPELVAVKYEFPAGRRRRDGEHHPPRREPRLEARHPLYVLPLAEGPAAGRAASGDPAGVGHAGRGRGMLMIRCDQPRYS